MILSAGYYDFTRVDGEGDGGELQYITVDEVDPDTGLTIQKEYISGVKIHFTDNMFGDIITDLGAMVQGGMGIAAGGNINPEGTSMFEPIGGSAPKYTGQNVINPLAAICAGQMMLDHLGEREAAAAIEKTVIRVTNENIKDLGAGRMGYSTSEVGDLVASSL